ncbi:hypothetical protein EIP86_000196 [Pleurotus ostreatoroseus]|nr:hypothetical protein EIP86_000196 [Pleurotus ostreatoroseus]
MAALELSFASGASSTVAGPTDTVAHSSTLSRSSKSSKAAIAAGTTVAAVAVAAVCCLTLLIARRKRARLRIATLHEGAAQPYTVAPTEGQGQPRLKTETIGLTQLENGPGATMAAPAAGIGGSSDSSSRRRTQPGAVNSTSDITPLTQLVAEMRRILAAMHVAGPEQVDGPPPEYRLEDGYRQ